MIFYLSDTHTDTLYTATTKQSITAIASKFKEVVYKRCVNQIELIENFYEFYINLISFSINAIVFGWSERNKLIYTIKLVQLMAIILEHSTEMSNQTDDQFLFYH